MGFPLLKKDGELNEWKIFLEIGVEEMPARYIATL